MKSFVNFPFIRFKKANLHNWANRKYIESEKVREKIVDYFFSKYAKLYAQNKTLVSGVLNGVFDFDLVSEALYNLVRIFTYKDFQEVEIKELTQYLLSVGINAQIQDDDLIVNSDDLSFKVRKLSKLEPQILNVLPDIEEPTRGGKCHQYALVVTRVYNKVKEVETYLVSGEIYQLCKADRYLHSWVEIYDGEKVFVIDPTRNAVLSKEAFYKINHVGKAVKIHSSVVERDLDMLMDLFEYDGVLSKVYFENPKRGRNLHKKLVEIGEIEESKQVERP